MKYYLFPTLPKLGSLNPYINDFSNALSKKAEVVNKNRRTKSATLDLLLCSFSADCYIFNWIENTPFKRLGLLQSLVFLTIIFPILKIRRAKIYWIFHNFRSHQGTNLLSNVICKIMMKHSDAIITHSREALTYLENHSSGNSKLVFNNHPIKKRENKIAPPPIKKFDILIWGSIEPYKGIVEFLNYCKENNKEWSIKIIGKCKDKDYGEKIKSLISGSMSFENRIVPFDELQRLIAESRCVLFPYLKDSVSSSGALIDTISFYGSAIGPNRGAFADLKNEGVCYTFDSYDDIDKILNDDHIISRAVIDDFIKNNSWDNFANKIININNNEKL